jgi:hypothetical protein
MVEKSLDDVSSVTGGFIAGASGPVAFAAPQNPFNTRAEKGPSSFDVAHTFTLSVAQDLQLDRAAFLQKRKSHSDERLGVAEHLQYFQRSPVYRRFRHSADRSGLERRG